MGTLFVLALIVAVAKLWSDVRALRLRVHRLEWGGVGAVAPQEWRPYPQPDAWQPYPQSEPEQHPWRAPATEPTPQMTARVVRTPEPAETPAMEPAPGTVSHPMPLDAPTAPLPHRPALEPEFRFSNDAERSGGSGQARGDEETQIEQPRRPIGFEDIFGRKLPIWAGGITLAVCGFLIVKYSIEAGLLSPIVRVVGGLLFGGGLIAGAEAARQNADRVRDPRVAQALSGAGIATLYASILAATNLYHLIPPLAAFLFMAATTLLAGALSMRFGAPSAVLGLVGGFAAPALVGSGNPNVPLLAAYLSLAVGGLATLGRAQRWWWLGVAALAGGFGWGMVLIVNGALGLADTLSVGGFLLLLGIGLPVLLFGGERGHLVRLAGTLAATAQLAALVATGGFAMLNWGLFALLGAAAVWLSRWEKPLADLPAPAMLTALLLMAAWPHPTPQQLAIVLGGAAVIFGLPAAWRAWRLDWRMSDAGTVCALAAAPLALALYHFTVADRTATLLALFGATAAAAVAAWGWRAADRLDDSRFGLLTATTGLLLMTAAAFGLDSGLVAPVWAALAGAFLLLALAARDGRVEASGWAIGFAALAALPFPPAHAAAFDRLWGEGTTLDAVEAARWAVAALVALLFALASRWTLGRALGSIAAVLIGYGAASQVVPAAVLPLVPAIALGSLGWSRRAEAANVTAGALAAAWAAWPLAQWLAVGGGALVGLWVNVRDLPPLADTGTRLLAPALAAALVLWRRRPTNPRLRLAAWVAVALLATAVAHIGYKQLFALATVERFVTLGLAERTLWEALLAAAALATSQRWPTVARGFGLAAAAHLGWFTLVLHNPLWSEQAVGGLPVANLLLPAYALGFALLWVDRHARVLPERARGWTQMLLVGLLAASELRQLWHGTLLVGGRLTQAEDIARSIVAVGIAVGFLLWGIRSRQRDWRIASLAVMLGAVLKVFLLDVYGLHGLLQIASFAALGFSLLGIGWLYSRYLPDDAAVNPSSAPSA